MINNNNQNNNPYFYVTSFSDEYAFKYAKEIMENEDIYEKSTKILARVVLDQLNKRNVICQ